METELREDMTSLIVESGEANRMMHRNEAKAPSVNERLALSRRANMMMHQRIGITVAPAIITNCT